MQKEIENFAKTASLLERVVCTFGASHAKHPLMIEAKQHLAKLDTRS